MKKIVVLLVSAAFTVLLGSQVVPAAQHQFPGLEQQHASFKTVTPQEAKNMIENRNDLLLIDVRGQDELIEGYIAGSTLILLICAVGGRSLALGQLMSKNGWDEVYNLKGGISAWKDARLPVKY